jgi:hypothetical protein
MQQVARCTRRLAIPAAVALTAFVIGSPVGADPDGGHGTRHVQFTGSPPVLVGGDFGCDPTAPTRCVGTFRNTRTLSGDFTGTAYQVGTATLLPDGTYQGAGLVLFTGAVNGCGSGTLTIIESGRLDPATGAGWGTWEITSGEGTGDLANVGGTLFGDTRIDNLTSGTIRCD